MREIGPRETGCKEIGRGVEYERGQFVALTDEDLARVKPAGGKIVDVSRGQCPETVELGKSSAIGGVVLRSGLGGPKLAVRPVFVLVGGPWREVAAIRVLGGGRVAAAGSWRDRSRITGGFSY